jgi:hypothetical protein
MKLINTIIDKLPEVGKWQKEFFKAIITGFLGVTGKLNFRNISRYIKIHEKTISRQFSKFFPFLTLNFFLTKKAVGEGALLAFAFDPFFSSKAGDKSYGKDSFWNGSAGRAEKGLEFGLIALVDIAKNVAYPLSAKQTPSNLKGSAMNRMDCYIAHIADVVSKVTEKVNYMLVDAFFYSEKFVTAMRLSGLHVISKLRCNARLRHLYMGSQKARGRRKKYSSPVDFNDLSGFDCVKVDESNLTLYTCVAYSVALACNIRIVWLVQPLTNGKERCALLYSTDIQLSALDILRYYKARFQIEFIIRDAKQHTGLSDCQSIVQERIDFHVNTSLTALNSIKVEHAITYSQHSLRTPFSMLSSKVKNHNEMMIQSIFSTLQLDLDQIKSSPIYEQLINLGTISNPC